jgi:hypothetical protein
MESTLRLQWGGLLSAEIKCKSLKSLESLTKSTSESSLGNNKISTLRKQNKKSKKPPFSSLFTKRKVVGKFTEVDIPTLNFVSTYGYIIIHCFLALG